MTNCSVSTPAPCSGLSEIPLGGGGWAQWTQGTFPCRAVPLPEAKHNPHLIQKEQRCLALTPFPEASRPRRQGPGLPLAEVGCGSGRRGEALVQGAGPMEPWEVGLGPLLRRAPCSLWVLGPQRATAQLCA